MKVPKAFKISGGELDRVIKAYNDFVLDWNDREENYEKYIATSGSLNDAKGVTISVGYGGCLSFNIDGEEFSIENAFGFWTPNYNILHYAKWFDFYPGWNDWRRNIISLEDIRSVKVEFHLGCHMKYKDEYYHMEDKELEELFKLKHEK